MITDLPYVSLVLSAEELDAISAYFTSADIFGQVDINDQLYVRNECITRLLALPGHDRIAYLERAELLIRGARYAGIFAALDWWDSPTSEVRDWLARISERSA